MERDRILEVAAGVPGDSNIRRHDFRGSLRIGEILAGEIALAYLLPVDSVFELIGLVQNPAILKVKRICIAAGGFLGIVLQEHRVFSEDAEAGIEAHVAWNRQL